MLIDRSEQVSSILQSPFVKNHADSSQIRGNSQPGTQNPSDDSLTISTRARAMEAGAGPQLIDFRGEEGLHRLGLMALGRNATEQWAERGLNLSDESIIAAGQAFQDAFKQNYEQNASSMAGSRIALNKHQIVMNHQEVPAWFKQEYENNLTAMGNPKMANAFAQGELAFISEPAAANAGALARYGSAARV